MPARPKLVRETGVTFKSFDEYVAEANANSVPFTLPINEEESITVDCPTGDDIIALAEAQSRQDITAMAVAVFGDDAPRVLQLTGKQRFFVLARIVNDVMQYYGMQAAQLPES